MLNYDDNVKDFNDNGFIKYSTPTTVNESYVKILHISKDLINELNSYLKSEWDERGEYAPLADVFKKNGVDTIYFDISWGDWRHDHMRLYHFVNTFFRDRGYVVEREVNVTETDGSDTYSAEHFYTVLGDDENDYVKQSRLDEKVNNTWTLYQCMDSQKSTT